MELQVTCIQISDACSFRLCCWNVLEHRLVPMCWRRDVQLLLPVELVVSTWLHFSISSRFKCDSVVLMVHA